MSIIAKIIVSETKAEKNATKRIIDNAASILKEAREIAHIRAHYRGVEFKENMMEQGFGFLAERDQRNNLAAIVWLADEGQELFTAWLANDDRPNCSTIRGIKKAVSPKQERKPRQNDGGNGDGEEQEAVEANAKKMTKEEVLALALSNALSLCKKHGITPDQFVEYMNSDESLAVYDEAM